MARFGRTFPFRARITAALISAPISVAMGVGALTVTGFAPTVAINLPVAMDTGALTVTGLAPAVVIGTQAYPDVGVLTVTGLAPTVSISNNTFISEGLGALTLTGLAPAVSLPVTASPGVGALTLNGLAPTVLAGVNVPMDTGALTLTGLAPAVSLPIAVPMDVGALTVTGFAPTATGSVTPSAASDQPQGGSRRKWAKRTDRKLTDDEKAELDAAFRSRAPVPAPVYRSPREPASPIGLPVVAVKAVEPSVTVPSVTGALFDATATDRQRLDAFTFFDRLETKLERIAVRKAELAKADREAAAENARQAAEDRWNAWVAEQQRQADDDESEMVALLLAVHDL